MTADDIFVRRLNLVSFLQDMSITNVADLWIGRVHIEAPPSHSMSSKYYVPIEMYKWLSHPDYTAGASCIKSSDVSDKIYHATLALHVSLYIDDVLMGICANVVGMSPQDHVYHVYHECIYSQMMTSQEHLQHIHKMGKAATYPRVKQHTSGSFRKVYLHSWETGTPLSSPLFENLSLQGNIFVVFNSLSLCVCVHASMLACQSRIIAGNIAAVLPVRHPCQTIVLDMRCHGNDAIHITDVVRSASEIDGLEKFNVHISIAGQAKFSTNTTTATITLL